MNSSQLMKDIELGIVVTDGVLYRWFLWKGRIVVSLDMVIKMACCTKWCFYNPKNSNYHSLSSLFVSLSKLFSARCYPTWCSHTRNTPTICLCYYFWVRQGMCNSFMSRVEALFSTYSVIVFLGHYFDSVYISWLSNGRVFCVSVVCNTLKVDMDI